MNALKRAGLSIAAMLAASALLPVAGASAATAPAVAHAPCGTGAPDLDSGSWNATGAGANMRSGSSTTCAIQGTADSGDPLDYHCYTIGNDSFTWTYTRNDASGVQGWIRDDLLSDNGSIVYCGF